jgi:hypothetical protein
VAYGRFGLREPWHCRLQEPRKDFTAVYCVSGSRALSQLCKIWGRRGRCKRLSPPGPFRANGAAAHPGSGRSREGAGSAEWLDETRPQNQAGRPCRGAVGPTCCASFCQWSRSRRKSSISCRSWSRLAFTSARSRRNPKISASSIRSLRVKSSLVSFIDCVSPSGLAGTALGRLRTGAGVGAEPAKPCCRGLYIITELSLLAIEPSADVP